MVPRRLWIGGTSRSADPPTPMPVGCERLVLAPRTAGTAPIARAVTKTCPCWLPPGRAISRDDRPAGAMAATTGNQTTSRTRQSKKISDRTGTSRAVHGRGCSRDRMSAKRSRRRAGIGCSHHPSDERLEGPILGVWQLTDGDSSWTSGSHCRTEVRDDEVLVPLIRKVRPGGDVRRMAPASRVPARTSGTSPRRPGLSD